jgi:hypothetical protein
VFLISTRSAKLADISFSFPPREYPGGHSRRPFPASCWKASSEQPNWPNKETRCDSEMRIRDRMHTLLLYGFCTMYLALLAKRKRRRRPCRVRCTTRGACGQRGGVSQAGRRTWTFGVLGSCCLRLVTMIPKPPHHSLLLLVSLSFSHSLTAPCICSRRQPSPDHPRSSRSDPSVRPFHRGLAPT